MSKAFDIIAAGPVPPKPPTEKELNEAIDYYQANKHCSSSSVMAVKLFCYMHLNGNIGFFSTSEMDAKMYMNQALEAIRTRMLLVREKNYEIAELVK